MCDFAIYRAPAYCARFPDHGFSLLELLTVLVLLGVLASVALPSYQRYQEQTLRSTAIAALLKCNTEAERVALSSFSYLAIDPDSDGIADLSGCDQQVPQHEPAYQIRVRELTARTFRFEALPLDEGRVAGNGKLTLDEKGNAAWDKNNDGLIELPKEYF